MTWHDFTIRFETPAFLGQNPLHAQSANQIPFPIPSLRGALRFWLRAMLGAFTSDLDAVLDIETRVFGAASGDTKTPSPILLRAAEPIRTIAPGVHQQWLQPGPGQPFTKYHTYYLLGQGLWADRQLIRRHVSPDTSVTIRVRNIGDPTAGDLFLAALWALRTFGGLGSRTRRGFGTFELLDAPAQLANDFDVSWLTGNTAGPFDQVMLFLLRQLGSLRTSGHPGLPSFPCFGRNHCHRNEFSLDQHHLADALARTGQVLRAYYAERGQPSPEYDNVARPYLGNPRAVVNTTPLIRGAMGLPVNYGDSNGAGNAWRNAVVEPLLDGEPARRASPLWLRVFRDGTTWKLRWLLFITEWMPPNVTLRIRNTRNAHLPSATVQRPSAAEALAEMRRWTAYINVLQGPNA